MRYAFIFGLLLLLKRFVHLFYAYEEEWVGDGRPEEPWGDYRVAAVFNHTSLFEFLFVGVPEDHFLWRIARHGLIPIASKTTNRPVVGFFWKWFAGNIVPISRERDHTWKKVLEAIGPDSMAVVLPEGRMKRANGRDAFGRPLMVRGGIADILEAIPEGRMLLAYSQGLHHIQIPGQRFPHLFKTARLRLESVDIAAYHEAMKARGGKFKDAVIADLSVRRDRYCLSDVGEVVPVADPAGAGRELPHSVIEMRSS